MKTIIVVQHTESIHHTNGMVGAWTDWDLSAKGRVQAQNIGMSLRSELEGKEYVLYSSDLNRAIQTAEPLLNYIPSAPILCKELREINEGEATGESREWYNQNKAENTYGTAYSDYKAFPGSESYREVWQRAGTFLDRLLRDEHANIVMVSHGITLHLFFARWIGLDFEDLGQYGLMAMPGGVSRLLVTDDGRRMIDYLNNMSHKEYSARTAVL